MDKNKILLSVAITSMIAVGAVFAVSGGLKSSSAIATNGEVWHHYAAVKPTETTHGSKEFWASSTDGCATHTFTNPGPEVTCEEHDFSTYDSFASLSRDDDRYVWCLNEQWGITPVVTEKTVTYGLYPQKNVNDSSLVSALNGLAAPESNGWYLYNDEYYAKVEAKPYQSSYTFDNGTIIDGWYTYWFKCEPITWNVLSDNDGEYYVLSSVLLDTHCYYNSTSSTRTIDDKTIYRNNYEYSDIRTWLNNDFYNSAFALGNSHIQTTTVDNSEATTASGKYSYTCNNTQDKVFLPSYQDYIESSYGFSTSTSSTNTRYCKATDWARARGARCNTSPSYLYNGYYWTRSPSNDTSFYAWYVNYDGGLDDLDVDKAYHSVRPAISIKIA